VLLCPREEGTIGEEEGMIGIKEKRCESLLALIPYRMNMLECLVALP